MSDRQELTKLLAISTENHRDDVLAAVDMVKAFMDDAKELQRVLEEMMIEWINERGPIEIGTKKYYVGVKKTTKPHDLKAAVVTLMEESGGDWDAFVGCLSSDAIKPGAAKGVLGDKWEEVFYVTKAEEVREGKAKPKKSVMLIDSKFTK